MGDTCVCGGSKSDPNPDCERCNLIFEVDRLRSENARYIEAFHRIDPELDRVNRGFAAFREMTRKVRRKQCEYFDTETRTGTSARDAIALERQLDKLLAEYDRPATLFGREDKA